MADDDFTDWEDQIFRVQDRTDDLFIHLEDMFPAAGRYSYCNHSVQVKNCRPVTFRFPFSVRDYSILLGGTPDGNAQFRTLQVPLREETVPTEAAQAMPPAPSAVTTSHPLLVSHTDPHGGVTYRVYRGGAGGAAGGRQRSYRLTTPGATYQVFSSSRRHPNPAAMLSRYFLELFRARKSWLINLFVADALAFSLWSVHIESPKIQK